nr:S-layer homology domain-containing protein [Paenibacillus sacheonensis]
MLAEQFGLQSSTKVRLTRPSGTIEQKLIRYTPYSLTFEVKAPQGVYGVEVSNDGGTAWNALSSGQTLTVVPKKQDPLQLGVAWAGDFNWDARFSVLSYGAVNDDDKDDTAAVIDAIEAAKTAGGGVVYFPAGDYYVGRIPMYADIVLLGENRDSTHLIYNSARANMFESEGDGAVNGHYGVSGFTVSLKDEAKRPDMFFAWGQPWSDAAGNMKLRTASEMFIHNVKLDYDLDSGFGQATPDPYAGMRGLGVVIIGQERFLVKDSDFSGWSAGITHAYLNEYTSYLGNDFRYSHEGYLQTVSNYSFAVGNTIHGPGWKRGMMKDNHGIFGRANVHMENNEVYDVGSDYNDGETYAVDSPAGNFNMGYVTNATADTLTTAPIAPYQDYAVMFNELAVQIVSGRGMGQLREVTGIEGNRLTIEGTWDVIPDGTSRFTLISPNDNVTIYNNYAENASKGIYIFGNSFDVVAANNHQKDTEGAFVWTALIQDAPAFVPAAHVAIRDNDFSGVSPKTQTGGILLNTQRYGSSGRYFSVGAYNIELRNNQLVGVPSAVPNNLSEAPYESGIVFWSGLKSSDLITDGYSGDATNLLVQNNKLSGFNRGISLTLGDYGILMADNTFNQVGEPVYNAGKDRVAGEAENVINLGGEASVDKGTLQQLYAAEIALNRSEASYEVPSWTAYSVALGSAEAVLNDGTATERTAQTALHALRSAIASLAPISVSPPGGGENPNTAPPRGNETAVPPSGGEDPDVTQPAAEKAWPAKGEAVHYNGPYLSGYSKDKIGPDNKLTRAEAVQLAYNLYERPTSQLKLGALSPYPDLDDAAWYAQAAAFSIQLELVRGYRDGTFRPDRDITRAEFLSLILHLRQLEPAATAAPFVDAQLHWAKPILDIAYSNGLIQGYPDGSFKPDSPITRAEAAALVNRLLQRGEEWTGTRAFADLPESHWAYDALMNAANGNNQ